MALAPSPCEVLPSAWMSPPAPQKGSLSQDRAQFSMLLCPWRLLELPRAGDAGDTAVTTGLKLSTARIPRMNSEESFVQSVNKYRVSPVCQTLF